VRKESPHPERLKRSTDTKAPLAWADGRAPRGGGEMVGLPVRASGGGVEARKCPFCGSKDTEVISLFGSQVITMQCKCRACGNFFEASKY